MTMIGCHVKAPFNFVCLLDFYMERLFLSWCDIMDSYDLTHTHKQFAKMLLFCFTLYFKTFDLNVRHRKCAL